MGDAIVGFGNSSDVGPDLAAFGNEVVVSYVNFATVFLR
jgi:hypothetical protein